jgi:tetratricopeptide (TPR) repeat protein
MGNESIAPLMSWMILKNSGIPQFLSYNQLDAQTQPVQNLLPYGLVYQCFVDQTIPALDEARASFLWSNLRLRHLHDSQLPLEPRSRQWILGDYGVDRNGLGIYFENRADDEAEKIRKNPGSGNRDNVIQDYYKSFRQFSWCRDWDPSDPVYCFNMGNALVHLSQNSEALQYYGQAVELDSKYKDAYFNAAVAALNLGQGQKAGEMFRKVLDLDPSHAEAKRGLDYVEHLGWYHSSVP